MECTYVTFAEALKQGNLKCLYRQDPLNRDSFVTSKPLPEGRSFPSVLTKQPNKIDVLSEGETASGAWVYRLTEPIGNYGDALLKIRKSLKRLSPEYKKYVGNIDTIVVKKVPIKMDDGEDDASSFSDDTGSADVASSSGGIEETEEVFNEIVAGYQLNRLRLEVDKSGRLIPQTHSFMLVYDWLKIFKNPTEQEQVIVLENGVSSLGRWLKEKSAKKGDYFYAAQLNVFLFQLLHALEVGWNLCGFIHNDLHHENVMIKEISKSFNRHKWVFERSFPYSSENPSKKYVQIDNSTVLHRKVGLDGVPVPLIIDYGRSRLQTPFGNADLRYPLVGKGVKGPQLVSKIICPKMEASDILREGSRSGALNIKDPLDVEEVRDVVIRIPSNVSKDVRTFSIYFLKNDTIQFIWKHCFGMVGNFDGGTKTIGELLPPLKTDPSTLLEMDPSLASEYGRVVTPLLLTLLNVESIEKRDSKALRRILTPDTAGESIARFGNEQAGSLRNFWITLGVAGLAYNNLSKQTDDIVRTVHMFCRTILMMTCIGKWNDTLMSNWWTRGKRNGPNYFTPDLCRRYTTAHELKFLVFIRNVSAELETITQGDHLRAVATFCCLYSLINRISSKISDFLVYQWARNPVVYEHELDEVVLTNDPVFKMEIPDFIYPLEDVSPKVWENMGGKIKLVVEDNPTSILDNLEKMYRQGDGWSVLNEREAGEETGEKTFRSIFTPLWDTNEDEAFAVINNGIDRGKAVTNARKAVTNARKGCKHAS